VLPYNAVLRMTTIVRDWSDLRAEESIPCDGVLVWSVTLDVAAAASVLSEDEIERVHRYRFDGDRRRFGVCRTALRTILASYLHVAPHEIGLVTTANGKPNLDSRHESDVRFSVSHSNELALIALARNREVGVDVEHIRTMPGMDGVIRRYFSPSEAEDLALLPDHERRRAFFRIWTLKEAYLKGCGDGLTRRLDAIDVMVAADDQPASFQVRDRPGDETRWILRSIGAGESYAAALAVER
jgi:4'-phosphopantetheinyl transferase